MTSAQSITVQLQPYLKQGLQLWLEGDMLRFKATKEMLTPTLMGLLKQNKEAIIAWLKSEAESEAEPQQVDEFPLAFTQGAIWMLYRFAPNSPAYNTTFACTLKGELNEAAVRQAFHALMIRHPMLRTTFHDTDAGPRQQVWDHLPMPLELVDGSHWTNDELEHWLAAEADAPFDLTTTCCLRVKLVRNSVRGNILIATIHHVGADLWALLIVAKDIKDYYQRAARGEVLSLEQAPQSYRRHVEWQQSFMESERGKVERRFWQRALQGAPMTITVPPDFDRPPVLQLKTQLIRHELDGESYRAIRQFCKQHSITPFVFLQSALQLMVHHVTGARDFLLGTPTMGRSQKGMDQVVGDFANPVVLRARLPRGQLLYQLFAAVKHNLLAAMEHQEYPFPAVVQDCNPPRDSSRTPLFQLMFVWHQGNNELLAQDDWIDSVLPLSGPRGAPYDLMLAVSDLGDRFELNWTYQTSLYHSETIEDFGLGMQNLIRQMLKPDNHRVVDCLASAALAPANKRADIHPCVAAETLLQEFPELRGREFIAIAQHREDGELLQRLFIGCDDDAAAVAIRRAFSPLPHWLDDVAVYPRLPHHDDGVIDLGQLAQLPSVNHKRIAEQIHKVNGADDDVIVVRRRDILPSCDEDELDAFRSRNKPVVKPLRHVDVSERPVAWMVGDTFVAEADAPTHLFQALERSARRFPNRGLTLLDGERNASHYGYPQLVHDARVAAAGILAAGLKSGDILLLQMRFDRRFFAVWWGAVLLGVRPLNVATPDHFSQRNGVAQKLYNVAHNFAELTVAADRERVDATREWLGSSKTVIDADALLEHGSICEQVPSSQDPVAFLQLTSGSTGTPKAIQITHYGILHHVAASARYNGYSSDDINLNWLPFDHVVPILTTHVKDCVMGIQQIQLTTASVLADPLWWLQAMDQYRVTHSWAPNFAFQRVVEALADASATPDINLSAVRFLMNAGEQVLAPVVQRFAAACEAFGLRPHAVQPAFGMAEACTCMTYNNNSSELLSVHFNNTLDATVCDISEAAEASHGFVDLGGVMPGIEVRITDTDNEVVKEGVIGRMQIRGPVITPGYLNNPDANAEAFVGDGWFNSGDLGFIWNQRLILTGREKEMIVVHGANYYCFELEQAVTIPGVVPTFVAATGVALEQGGNSDALVLFYVSDHSVDATELERTMSARAVEAFGIAPTFIIEVEQDNFYKTTSGKIQRGQFKKNFESDVYSAQARDYLERHRQKQDAVDTLFQLDWECRASVAEDIAGSRWQLLCAPSLQSQVQSWVGNAVPVVTADFNNLSAQLCAGAAESRHLLVVLEGIDEASTTGLDHSLHRLATQMGQLKTLLLAQPELDSGHLTIAIPGHCERDLLLFKPLLETLRQETGRSSLRGCVIASGYSNPQTLLQQLSQLDIQVRWVDGDLIRIASLAAVDRNAAGTGYLIRRGTYLITGGLGGLAEPLAEYLVNRFQARLILVGRTPLAQSASHRFRWGQLLQRFGAASVSYQCCADWESLTWEQAVRAGLDELGANTLDGVFHLAGTLEMAALDQLEPDHWRRNLDAKLEGTHCLADYLEQHWPGSILVQYGSVNSFLGGQSAAAYSVANAIQASVTERLNQGGRVRSWCLNWSVWRDLGMARQFSDSEIRMARNKGLIPLERQRDLFWLATALTLSPGNYYVGIDAGSRAMAAQLNGFKGARESISLHLQSSLFEGAGEAPSSRDWLQQTVIPISLHVGDPLVEQRTWDQPWQRDEQGRPDLDALLAAVDEGNEQGVPPEDQVEAMLVDLWSSVLGRAIPDVTRSFFEYGGHSINATQLVAAINRQFPGRMTVAHLFQYPSIRAMAPLLREESVVTADYLSLGLQDCIERGDRYRLDCVNPQVESTLQLVFLPTAAGMASAYQQLMAQLSEFRMHVLSLPLVKSGEQPISESADEFIKLINQTGLDASRIVLVGWSMGGVLGYEMLRQLSTQQQVLPPLMMLDSGFGVGLHPITFDADFQLLMFAVELGLTPDKIATFNQCKSSTEKLEWLKQYLEQNHIEVTQPMLLEWSIAYHKRLESLKDYAVSDTLQNALVTLIKAELHPHGRDDLGWGEANKNINCQSVPADHQGIVKYSGIADRLRTFCLESEKANGTE